MPVSGRHSAVGSLLVLLAPMGDQSYFGLLVVFVLIMDASKGTYLLCKHTVLSTTTAWFSLTDTRLGWSVSCSPPRHGLGFTPSPSPELCWAGAHDSLGCLLHCWADVGVGAAVVFFCSVKLYRSRCESPYLVAVSESFLK